MSRFEKWGMASLLAFVCLMAAAGWGIMGYIVMKNAACQSPPTLAPEKPSTMVRP